MAIRNHREARAQFKRLIAEGSISWTYHAKARMRERDVIIGDILSVLQAGYEVEGPIREISGDWSCKFAGNSALTGLHVVAVLVEQGDETCLVVTVIR